MGWRAGEMVLKLRTEGYNTQTQVAKEGGSAAKAAHKCLTSFEHIVNIREKYNYDTFLS